MAVNYKTVDSNIIGLSVITNIDTAPCCKIGSLVKGLDTSSNDYGEAEFEYCKLTSTLAVAAGDFVIFDRGAKTCVGVTQALVTASKGCIGIQMAATTIAQGTAGVYGWVMARGVHDGANVATGVVAGASLGAGTTAGRAIATSAGFKFDGAYERVSTASGNVGVVGLEWPFASGNS